MTAPVEPLLLVFATLIIFVGSIIQGSIGFGLGSLAVPLLLFLDPLFVPGPMLLLGITLNGMIFWRDRLAIDKVQVSWAIAGRLAGTLVGAFILVKLDLRYFTPLACSLVLIGVLLMHGGYQLSMRRRNLASMGVLSGIMGTVASIGGAPMGLVYASQEGSQIRGSLSLIFFIGTMVSVISLALIGRIGKTELLLALFMIPAMLMGFLVSRHVHDFVDRGHARRVILIIASLAALTGILRFVFTM